MDSDAGAAETQLASARWPPDDPSATQHVPQMSPIELRTLDLRVGPSTIDWGKMVLHFGELELHDLEVTTLRFSCRPSPPQFGKMSIFNFHFAAPVEDEEMPASNFYFHRSSWAMLF